MISRPGGGYVFSASPAGWELAVGRTQSVGHAVILRRSSQAHLSCPEGFFEMERVALSQMNTWTSAYIFIASVLSFECRKASAAAVSPVSSQLVVRAAKR